MSAPAGTVYDLTRPLHEGHPVWPGDSPLRFHWVALRSDGAGANVGMASFGLHTGTHLDAPLHVLDHGASVDRLPLDTFVGPAVVMDVRGAETINREHLPSDLGDATRILFRTGAWTDEATFPTRYPALDPEFATALGAAGIRLVGTDAPSVDPHDSTELPAHHALLGASIVILENLRLDEVPPGRYELTALPLPFVGADASPVRAILRSM